MRDWKGAVARFQQQKLNHGNTISVATWNKAYQPVLDMSVLLLNGPTPPGRPVDLIDRCVADWEPGSRMRQIRCQSLAQFLRHCVQRSSSRVTGCRQQTSPTTSAANRPVLRPGVVETRSVMPRSCGSLTPCPKTAPVSAGVMRSGCWPSLACAPWNCST